MNKSAADSSLLREPKEMLTEKLLSVPLFVAVILTLPSMVVAKDAPFDLQNANTQDRMTYHCAFDAAVWAMPLMNFKFYRDALADAGL